MAQLTAQSGTGDARRLKRGHIDELIDEAPVPLVTGTPLTSVQDLIWARKYGHGSGNPLRIQAKPPARYAYVRQPASGLSFEG